MAEKENTENIDENTIPVADDTSSTDTSKTTAKPAGRSKNFGDKKRAPREKRKNNRREKPDDGFKEVVVNMERVTKVVKGGRRFRFSALVVVGDGKGQVGVGSGKATEIPDAIRKAIESAKKNLITVPIVGTSIPHEIIGEFGAGRVLMKPAKEGTGVIAGGPVRNIFELLGVKDIRTKTLRSKNPRNVVYATFEGLKQLRNAEAVAESRGISVGNLYKGVSAS